MLSSFEPKFLSTIAARTILSHGDYTVGWICALPLEMAAAKLMLDALHPSLPLPSRDQNTYILGNIGQHNIVIACLPTGAYGTTSAATVAVQLLSSFHSIRFSLMVGIGGGVPSSHADIRLGDIVVSQPTDTFGGVIQYDLGKVLSGSRFQRTGMLNRPPKVLLTALATLRAYHLTEDSQVPEFLSNIKVKIPGRATKFARPNQEDWLYQADYEHGVSDTCVDCDQSRLVSRPSRGHNKPVIHYGLIASANQVIKDGRRRDQLAQELGVHCVEMEAAGLMNDFPCLVIRGICDYADSHKNKDWQGYAAAAAAAFAKELLSVVPISHIDNAPTAQQNLAHAAPCFDIPFDLTAIPAIENFLGRQDEVEQLWLYLQPEHAISRKVAILHGLGGIGKTQLAIHFARKHKNDFTAIFWLSCKDRSALVSSLSSCLPRIQGQPADVAAANEEEAIQRANQVLQWLARPGNTRWLIIFDNTDQYCPHQKDNNGYDICDFFPKADHGSIIITSRLQRLTELGKSFPVQKLMQRDAIQLLLQSSGFSAQDVTQMGAEQDMTALINRLDGLSLAIVLAGAFMRETGTSFKEYLQFYEDSWLALQSESKPTRHYHQGNILQTWIVTYQEIQKRDPGAARLLLFLTCFDNRDIWYELIQSGLNCTKTPHWLATVVSSKLAFKTTIKTLVGFSLIETNQQLERFTIHPVVQDWCFHIAASEILTNQLRELALISVGYMVPSQGDRDYIKLQQRLIPHANYLTHLVLTERLDRSGNRIDILDALLCLGNLYSDQGRLKEAEEIYQRAMTGYEKAVGPDHTSILDTVNNLGNLYYNQGRLKEAEAMLQQALAGYKNTLGPDHTSTLGTVNNLGVLYWNQGRLKKAEEMYQQALAGKENALGPDHTSTLNTVSNLGILYSNQGRLKEAEEMYQQALAGKENTLGPDHTSTLDIVNNLGVLYWNQGRLKEAEDLYQRALAGCENALGPDHTSTLDTVSNLGILYSNQGRVKEAEEMYQRALAGYEKALGLDHAKTRMMADNLASLASLSGE
ncbi:hypothetical protein BDV06DRAFT_215976 [Aspergillus oleicola]